MIIDVDRDQLDFLIDGIDAARYEMSDQHYRHSGFVLDPGSDDPETAEKIARLNELEARLEALQHQVFHAEATAWEERVRNTRGNPTKRWIRMVEIRIFAEVLYVFRARPEDLIAVDPEIINPITSYSIMLWGREYRTNDTPPEDVHIKALQAFRGIGHWILASGLNRDALSKAWPNS